ncbi:MAG: multi-sensor hybrid histidine kinase [Cyanobacteria bacterium RYN_339]|nr:multi-sensor hybrid histidine kinase [Cyanobacteria bacterium RYN_339]
MSLPLVLVVDDNRYNVDLVVQLLEDDFEVQTAANGLEALQQIARRRPDLIVLDLMMPVLDGFGVLERLQAEGGPFLPVIVASAATEREARLRALKLGAHEVLAKPIDGEELRVRIGTLLALKASYEEISALQRAALADSEARFQAFMDHAPLVASIKDAEGSYLYANRAMKTSGMQLTDNLVALEREVRTTGRAAETEETVVGEDGDTRRYLVLKFPIQEAAGGQLLGGIGIDITERQRLVEALQAADHYKDEFLAVVSHELRTPLNFIMGFTSLLADEVQGPVNAGQLEALEKILMGTDRMLRLVDELLDFARLQTGKFRLDPIATDLNDVVREVVTAMAPAAAHKGIRLVTDVQVPGRLMLDGPRLGQVLFNLVDNAIKFTPAQGAITLRAWMQADVLHLEVSDTGRGIAVENLARIFRRFEQVDMSNTRAANGVGLGLSIVKALVEAHGGQLEVKSDVGRGATFRIALPVAQDSASTMSRSSSA